MSYRLIIMIIPRLGAFILLSSAVLFSVDIKSFFSKRNIYKPLEITVYCLLLFLASPLLFAIVAGVGGFVIFKTFPNELKLFFQMWYFALVLYMIIRSVVRLFYFIADLMKKTREKPLFIETRRDFLKGPFLLIPPLVSSYFTALTMREKYDLVINAVHIPYGKNKDTEQGLSFVQISDLHLGQFFGPDKLNFYLNKVLCLKPDLVFLTGDIINSENSSFSGTISLWKNFTSQVPVIACMGNHDYFDNPLDFAKIANKAGIQFLLDEKTYFKKGSFLVQIGALEYSFRKGTTEKSLLKIDLDDDSEAFTVLLSHNPQVFDHVKRANFDIMLSGHTHGGQIVFDRSPHGASIIDPFIKYRRGMYRDGKRKLYVNSGLGSWFALRLNCPPEITFFKLGSWKNKNKA